MRPISLFRAIVVVLIASLGFGWSGVAQTLTVPPDGITVLGQGRASAPPDRTTFQISLSTESYGPPAVPQPGATPGVEEREQIQPVVDALVDVGVPEADMTVVVPPFLGNAFSGPFGPSTAYIEFTINDPTTESIEQIVTAASIGAAESGLLVGYVNLLHTIEDCSTVQQDARMAAFEHAQQQATQQAEVVGMTLGDVTGVRDSYLYGPPLLMDPGPELSGEGGCTYTASTNIAYGPFGPTPYDIASEPEVVVFSMIEVTFSIQSAATPAP